MDDSEQAFLGRPKVPRTPPQVPHSPVTQSPGSPMDLEDHETFSGVLESMGTALDGLFLIFSGQRHINTLVRVELAKVIELHKLLKSLATPDVISVVSADTPKRLRDSLSEQRKTASSRKFLRWQVLPQLRSQPKEKRTGPLSRGDSKPKNGQVRNTSRILGVSKNLAPTQFL